MNLDKKGHKNTDELQRLKELLNDKNVEVRRGAIYSLKRLKDASPAVPLLIKCFEDKDWRVRKSAIEVLLEIKDEKVIKALIETLYSEDANARNSAIEALVLSDKEATDYLIDAFETSDSDVRKFIIDILGSRGDSKAISIFLRGIEDGDENIQAAAIEHLGNFKNASVIDKLVSILKGDNIWLCYHAAEALGKVGDNRAVSALLSTLARKELRRPTIKALGQIAELNSLSSVVPFLKDESRSICEETVMAIWRYYQKGISEEVITRTIKESLGDEALSILQPHFQSSKKEISRAATLLLGLLFSDREAVARILEMASGGEEELKEVFIRALVFIGRRAPESLKPFFNAEDDYQRRILCEVAGRTGSPAFFDSLITMLQDEDGHVRGNAAMALSNLKNSEAVEHIKPLLVDEYKNVQEEAIRALTVFKKELDLNEIIMGLSDVNPVLRKNSAILLGSIGENAAVEPLGIALKDSEVEVRVSVVDALGTINGETSVKYLLLALTDESPDVRRAAAFAISKIHSKKSVDSLILLLRDPDIWVRVAAAKGLGQIGDREAIEPLIGLLSDDSGVVRTTAVEALGNFNEERVKGVLLKLLTDRDPEIRSTAVESLSIFKGIVHDLVPLLKDEEWVVRKKVVDVLGRFFRDESYLHLREVVSIDTDNEVRKTALRYLGD